MSASVLLRRRFTLAGAAAALLLGCIPHPGGECGADSDCTGGLTCQQGLCRPRPLQACAPGCEAGFHCDDGACALDAAPVVAWLSPEPETLRAGGLVALALTVATPARDVQAAVLVRPRSAAPGVAPVAVALAQEAGGTFRALLDAGQLPEGDWTLEPRVDAAGARWGGPGRSLRVDRTGPVVELFPPAPAGGAFKRTDTIEVRARLRDPGCGVDPASVRLVAEGMADLAGTRLSQTDWTFRLPLSAPRFSASAGPLGFGVRAADCLGNAGAGTASVPVTRLLWRRDVGQGAPLRSSPALDAHHLFVGTETGFLVALDRAAGVTLWSRRLGGPVSASPARGERWVYAVSEGGAVEALDPEGGALAWSCPDLPPGVQFLSSPAIARVPGLAEDGGALEALVVSGAGGARPGGEPLRGGIWALQGTRGFPTAGGARTCWLWADTGGGRSSPGVDRAGAIYVGGEGARARKLRLAPDAAGVFTFREEWSLPAGDEVAASPAIAEGGVFFGDLDGNLQWVDAAGEALASQPLTLGEKLLSSPVIAFGTALVQGRDGTLLPVAAPRPAAAPTPTYVAQKIPGVSNVDSTPAVGADGTVYVSAGRSLRAFAPSGALLWEAPHAGAATASSPALGCDGTLYVGDASGALTAWATDSAGLAPGWPRFRHDARGTGNAATEGCE